MRIASIVAAVLLLFTESAPAQLPEPPLEEMKKLDWMIGRWEGTGRVQLGPGAPEEARVVETIKPMLGGAVLLVEGVGRAGTPGGPDDRVVHNALAVISFDRASGEYRMRAYRMDGMYVDPKIAVEDKGYTWEFEVPGRSFRYTMKLNEKGQWHEVGEMSMDGGKTWRNFFEMTLDRVASPGGP